MGVIGCDLDGTLAHYDHWRGLDHIGKPIEKMVNHVKKAIRDGNEVRIFTARANEKGVQDDATVLPIRRWLKEVGLPEDLTITNIKGFDIDEFWDDRARQVMLNKGEFLEEFMAEDSQIW